LHLLLRREVEHRRGSTPSVSLDAEPTTIIGDEHLLSRALRNLTDNAARHARSRVELSLHHERGDAVVRVLDDGPGIPPEDQDRIFERFIRLDPGRALVDGGAGLGLPIAREIAHAHGGSLTVVASLQGTLFELRLPRVPSGRAQ
jgi:signal transduction histidine kinase